MTNSPRFDFTYWEEGDTQPQTKFNDLAKKLDLFVGLSVKSRTTDAEPGTPDEGDAYIITGSATGTDWDNFTENYIAHYFDSAWLEYEPPNGLQALVADEDLTYTFDGTDWIDPAATYGYVQETDIDTVAKVNGIVSDGPLATEAYADALLVGMVELKGDYNASTNSPDLDTSPSGVEKGDAYECTVAGTFFAYELEVGDIIIAKQDDPTTQAHWIINKKAGGGGGGLTIEFKTASFTAEAGKHYLMDSSGGAIAVTLPAGADLDHIEFDDWKGDAGTYNITLTPDGSETIDGGEASFVIDQDHGGCGIGYNDSASDWRSTLRGTPELVNVGDFIDEAVAGNETWQFRRFEFFAYNAAPAQSTGGGYEVNALDFDKTAYESAHTMVYLPERWDEGQFRFRVIWQALDTDTGDVIWGCYGDAQTNDAVLAAQNSVGASITATAPGITNAVQTTDWSSWFSFDDSPVKGGALFWRIQRNGGSGPDTYDNDARLLMVVLQWKSDAANDDE